MEMTPSLAHNAAEAGEGSAAAGYEAPPVPGPPAAAKMKKKTKKVVKTVSKEHVEFVLASKPMVPRSRPHPEQIFEELRRNHALYHKVVNARNDLLRSLQYQFRNDLATKGRVEVEVELTDDESED